MLVILLSYLLYLLSARKSWFYWLVLPVSLFFDLWRGRPLGYSGLIMLAVILTAWWLSPALRKNRYRI